MRRMRVGIIGCGNISEVYAKAARTFGNIELAACADLDAARAGRLAQEHGCRATGSVDELLTDPSIELVVNLTVPAAHAEIARAALECGKHVYNEKPLALDLAAASGLITTARERKLRLGCAPDTFLGSGLQTCRRLIDSGAIGTPVAASGFMLETGVELWHPNPEFFYKRGAGPLFDMAPYYITAFTTLLGPVTRVTGAARITHPQREIKSQPLAGRIITVETPSHVAGLLEFESGPVATLVTSFDIQAHQMPNIEIYGSEATLAVPDPNTFGGPVRIKRHGEKEWTELPLDAGYEDNSRGLGVADLIAAEATGRAHRATAATAFHVLEVMHGILASAESGLRTDIASTMSRPQPLPAGWTPASEA